MGVRVQGLPVPGRVRGGALELGFPAMELVVTHKQADFDAVASVWALHRLRPGSLPVLPGSVNRNVRRFLGLYMPPHAFYGLRDLPPMPPTALHVVDVKQLGRLDKSVQRLICAHPVDITVTDHHPWNRLRIPGADLREEALGACTTLLVEELLRSGQTITAEEATLYLLGIYEETGKLTYSGTSWRDAAVAAELLRRGARLFVLRQFIDEKLDESQQLLYQRAQRNLEVRDCRGVRLHLVFFAQDEYLAGLDVVAKKLREEYHTRTLILAVAMGRNVYVVARNSSPYVELLAVIGALGGGGHPFAAAASLKNTSLEEARVRIEHLLSRHIRRAPVAGDLMLSPVRWVAQEARVREADDKLRRSEYSVLPVLDADGRLCGILQRRDVDRALAHGLDNAPVETIMTRQPQALERGTQLEDMQELFLRAGYSSLPVVDESGHFLGLVTRTAFLEQQKSLDETEIEAEDEAPAEERIARRLVEGLGERRFALVRDIGRLAEVRGVKVYLVGGVVRDLLLGREAKDLDVVVEAGSQSAMEFFSWAAERLGGRLKRHDRFQTATLTLYDGTQVDFSTARAEHYAHPAALPQVEAGTIATDLARRDFTINALAVSVLPGNLGLLLDPFHGLGDLSRGILRILPNPLSFIDDPQRIFRLVRFVVRFSFQVEDETLRRVRYAVGLGAVERMEATRVRDELNRLFREPDPLACLQWMEKLDILPVISPALRLSGRLCRQLRGVPEALAFLRTSGFRPEEELLWLAVLFGEHPLSELESRLKRMQWKRREIRTLLLAVERAPAAYDLLNARQLDAERKCDLYELLQGIDDTGLGLVVLQGRSLLVRDNLLWYESSLRHLQLQVRGEDLRRRGLRPGPRYRRIMDRLIREKVAGLLPDEAAERCRLEELLDDAET